MPTGVAWCSRVSVIRLRFSSCACQPQPPAPTPLTMRQLYPALCCYEKSHGLSSEGPKGNFNRPSLALLKRRSKWIPSLLTAM